MATLTITHSESNGHVSQSSIAYDRAHDAQRAMHILLQSADTLALQGSDRDLFLDDNAIEAIDDVLHYWCAQPGDGYYVTG